MSKILVIDDEVSVRENIGEFLELNGYDVIYAADGVAGIEAAKSELPDLIICDIAMPEVDGYGVLQAVRRNSRTYPIPFLFLTAFTRRYENRKGMNLGADDYITKPYNPGEILVAVRSKLNKYQNLKEMFSDASNPIDSNLSLSIPLNMREPLDLIHRLSKSLYDNYNEIDDDQILSMIKNIDDSVITLNHTLENYIMFVDLVTNTQNKELTNIECSEPDSIIRYLLELYHDRYENVGKESVIMMFNRFPLCITDDHFEKIFDLIFEMAFKNYRNEGKIIIKSKQIGHNSMQIEIKFPGKGLNNEQVHSIMSFNPENPNHFANFNPSSGMILAREILKFYNGKFRITSRPDYDNTITIELQRSFVNRQTKTIPDDETSLVDKVASEDDDRPEDENPNDGQENYFR